MIENDAIPVKYATGFIYLSFSNLMFSILHSVHFGMGVTSLAQEGFWPHVNFRLSGRRVR
jgi:hypothetical protein